MLDIALLFLAAVMILLCGIFVAAEFSFVAVPRSEVSRSTRSGRGLRKALRRLSTQLSAAQIGITLTNLSLGFLAEPALGRMLEAVFGSSSRGLAFLLGFLLANILTVIFGELVPKNLAIARPLPTALAVQGLQRTFAWMLGPVLGAANGFSNRVLGLFGIEPQEELASARSAEELGSLVRRSAEQGTLEMPTARLLEKTLQFSRRNAEDAMTPRSQVHTLSPEDTVENLLGQTRETGRSRFPVLQDEEILGLAHMRAAMAIADRSVSVLEITEEAVLVPSSLDLDTLLEEIREGSQMALVIDEWGTFQGIVTLEDLVEEIVGEVHDEHDTEEIPMRRISPSEWEFSALLRPDELFRLTGIELPEGENYETVAGLIAYRAQKLPRVKDKIELQVRDSEKRRRTVTLKVNRIEGLRIDRVYMKVGRR